MLILAPAMGIPVTRDPKIAFSMNTPGDNTTKKKNCASPGYLQMQRECAQVAQIANAQNFAENEGAIKTY